jgi:hypothetical protein
VDASKPEKAGLYPLQALVTPVALRFKYHFDGSRQTNRMDKVRISHRLELPISHAAQPEWYFTHILNVAHEHRGFLDSVVQELLRKTSHKDISAWVGVLPFVAMDPADRFIRENSPLYSCLSSHGRLGRLSHLFCIFLRFWPTQPTRRFSSTPP